ncbi:MAG: class I SAM-dependent methyltransferase family protein [Candidatus ainarchaeum sp.]|nr:class I SAM-dependent methyltransferase family protein [Candidatus ainarchaeum sp.]
MLFLKVPRKQAENIRQHLIGGGILSKEYAVIKEDDYVLLPVIRSWGGFEVVELEVEKRPLQYKKLKDALSGLMTDGELDALTTSFDIIGDIAIVEIPDELEAKEKQIGGALLKVHKNLKTVLKKLGGMEGEYRVRRVKCIAGEDKTETRYRESGVEMTLDVAKVYFSVRLAGERKRIAELVKDGENVLVLFAGVGPFALVIAKAKPKTKITAVELNPEAVRYMKENISLNKLKNIKALEMDARDFDGVGLFDRVVMPLPKSAHEFLDVAFKAVKDGGIVHFYTIVGMKDAFKEAVEKAETAAKTSGVSAEVQSERIVRPYSPSHVQVVLDLRVKKSQ